MQKLTCAWVFEAHFVRSEEEKFYQSGALKELSMHRDSVRFRPFSTFGEPT